MKVMILIAGVISCLLLPAEATACSCPAPGDPCAASANVDVVFVGRAVAVEPASSDPANPRNATARLVVREVLQGNAPDAVVLRNGDGGDCFAVFRAGEDYLVYAKRSGAVLEAALCSRTGELAGRKHEVDLLRERRQGRHVPRLAGRIVETRQRVDGRPGSEALPLVGIAVTAQRGSDVFRTVTDADGDFVFVNVPQGVYKVSASLPTGYERVLGQDATVNVNCYGQATIGISRVPLQGTLATADGSPESRGVTVHAFAIDESRRVPSQDRSTYTHVARDGTWSLEGLPPGEYLIGVGVQFKSPWEPLRMPFWYPAATRLEGAETIRVGERGAVTLALRHPPAPREVQLSGVIVGPDGDPVEGGVWLHDVDAGHFVANSGSDSRGRFQVRGWEGRRYTITAYACQRRVPVMSEAVPVDPTSAGSLRMVLTRPCPASIP